jgi:hypothetical protein
LLLILLFPTGRPPSRRWSWLIWVSLGTVVAQILLAVLSPGPEPLPYFPIPRGLFSLGEAAQGNVEMLRGITTVIMPLCILLAVVSLVARLVRARGVERQEIKWFIFSAVIIAIGLPMSGTRTTISLIGIMFVGVGAAGVSITSAIAILRYRLWDIELIIRKTIVYSVLTVILALFYLISVVLLQELSQLITGQNQPPLITVISTLVSVALFNPLRRRIQAFIDRRFYRNQYNLERVMAELSKTFRDEVDLDQLPVSILQMVEGTLQPECASLWLRRADHPGENWQGE